MNESKKEILETLQTALRAKEGYGAVVVDGAKQPILKVITPKGEAFSITIK